MIRIGSRDGYSLSLPLRKCQRYFHWFADMEDHTSLPYDRKDLLFLEDLCAGARVTVTVKRLTIISKLDPVDRLELISHFRVEHDLATMTRLGKFLRDGAVPMYNPYGLHLDRFSEDVACYLGWFAREVQYIPPLSIRDVWWKYTSGRLDECSENHRDLINYDVQADLWNQLIVECNIRGEDEVLESLEPVNLSLVYDDFDQKSRLSQEGLLFYRKLRAVLLDKLSRQLSPRSLSILDNNRREKRLPWNLSTNEPSRTRPIVYEVDSSSETESDEDNENVEDTYDYEDSFIASEGDSDDEYDGAGSDEE